MATERLQKILARGGIASRRAAEELIAAGRVRLNGRVVRELGVKADPRTDRVEVDGRRVVAEQPVYVVLHKPRGVVTTLSDPEGRPSIREILEPVGGRVYPVGRLDFATSGVLLATNDGAFAEGLMHPRRGVPKTYVVKVHGVMEPHHLDVWRGGVQLEDGKTLPAQAKILRHEGDKTWFELTITEGRNQQVRRMGEATGFPVMRLARTSFAGISSEGLRPGAFRYLTRDELATLKKEFGVPKRIPAMVEQAPRVRSNRTPIDAPRPTRAPRGADARGQEARGQGRRGPEPRGQAPRGPEARGQAPRGSEPRGRARDAREERDELSTRGGRRPLSKRPTRGAPTPNAAPRTGGRRAGRTAGREETALDARGPKRRSGRSDTPRDEVRNAPREAPRGNAPRPPREDARDRGPGRAKKGASPRPADAKGRRR
jgi:23S rRNA pseudouridine2605 synthase